MTVTIKVIPHEKQRYATCGDWFWEGKNLVVAVSSLGDWRMEMCVGIHEAIEALLCQVRGVPQDIVDAFDLEYERLREPGDQSEPGDCIDAPYYFEHQIATGIERTLAAIFGISWNQYEDRIEALFEEDETDSEQSATT